MEFSEREISIYEIINYEGGEEWNKIEIINWLENRNYQSKVIARNVFLGLRSTKLYSLTNSTINIVDMYFSENEIIGFV